MSTRGTTMLRVRTTAALSLPFVLAGCNGAFWGNLVVLGVTLGIFFGTLSLGRASASTIRSAERSVPPSSRS